VNDVDQDQDGDTKIVVQWFNAAIYEPEKKILYFLNDTMEDERQKREMFYRCSLSN
jgi:hypothetical protein